MNEYFIYNLLIWGFGILSIIVFIILFFVSAPYGRHRRDNWGPEINNKIGWFLMEFPTVIIYFYYFIIGNKIIMLVPIIFLILWMVHYIQRALIFPFLIRGENKMPIVIMMFGLTFNTINSYLQSRWIYHFSDNYSINWIFNIAFISGIGVFLFGYGINLHSDYIIRNLRESGDNAHKIPRGGLFKWVSCPNYLGEIIEWGGWAIMTWSLSGLIFFCWTFANLAPRAHANHLWYQEKFPNYPDERKSLIPFVF